MSDDHMQQPESEKRSGTIQSITIAARFLGILSASTGPLPLSTLARESGTGKSTAHRYMQSLIKEGLAIQDPATGFYDLGPTALGIGISALTRIEPVEIAARHMKALAQAHAMSGGVAIWTERGPTLVRWYRSTYFSISSLGLGDVLPLDNTACGLMFQAFLPPETIEKVRLSQPEHFRGTAVNPSVLDDIRKTRRAELTSHLLPGVTGQAAPVFDAQQEIVCVMTTVTDLGQTHSMRDRDALVLATEAANRETGGAPLSPQGQ